MTLARTVGPGSAPQDPASRPQPAGDAVGPVAGAVGHAPPAPAPVPVPEPTAAALRYYRGGNALWAVGVLWGLLVPAVVLASGLSARLRDRVRRWTGDRWLASVTLFAVLYAGLVFLLDLPLAFYAGFVRQHAYGLSNQGLGKWTRDAATAGAISLAMAAAAAWFPYLLLRRSPRWWWLGTGLVALPVSVLLVLVSPIWIAPLFNDFGPMRDQALEARILALAERAGVPAERVFEVAKSVDTKRVNAYVTGLAGTHRIVLWDTLVDRLDDEQVLFVMGHEIGHYALGHVAQGLLLGAAGTLIALLAVHLGAGWATARWRGRFGFRDLADPASLPLLVLVFNLCALAGTPLALAWSRHEERAADRFALELTGDGRAAATAYVELQRHNLSLPRPGPIYRLFRASHPSLAERIEMANAYRPSAAGGTAATAPPAP